MKKYSLYIEGSYYRIEDKVNPANFSEKVYSIRGLPKKNKEEIIEFRSTDITENIKNKLIQDKENITMKNILG